MKKLLFTSLVILWLFTAPLALADDIGGETNLPSSHSEIIIYQTMEYDPYLISTVKYVLSKSPTIELDHYSLVDGKSKCYLVMSVSDYDTYALVGVALVPCGITNVENALKIYSVYLEKDPSGDYVSGSVEGDPAYTEDIAYGTTLSRIVKKSLDPNTELLLTGSRVCSDYWCDESEGFLDPSDIAVPPNLTLPIWFPWESGSLMVYSVLGLHNPGYGIAPEDGGAVDFLSDGDTGSLHAPNMMFTAMAGDVVNVCHDGLQTALYYKSEEAYIVQAHLQYDNRISIGQSWDIGLPLGPMITGSHPEARCGYTDQLDTHFHIHYAFKWQVGGAWGIDKAFRTEDWFITTDGIWQDGHAVLDDMGVGDWMTSTWTTSIDEGDPFAGEFHTVFDFILDGVVTMTENAAGGLPEHNPMGIAKVVGGVAGIAINIVFMMLLTNFDMRLFASCVGIILFIQMVIGVKNLISTIKSVVPFL
jgi:hypothetical protein